MHQVTKTVYDVATGEGVTLTFTPSSPGDGNSTVTVVHSPNPTTAVQLQPDPASPDRPTFNFTITNSVGNSEAVEYQCTFLGNVPNTADFKLALKGSGGGGTFQGPTISVLSSVKLVDLLFRVVPGVAPPDFESLGAVRGGKKASAGGGAKAAKKGGDKSAKKGGAKAAKKPSKGGAKAAAKGGAKAGGKAAKGGAKAAKRSSTGGAAKGAGKRGAKGPAKAGKKSRR